MFNHKFEKIFERCILRSSRLLIQRTGIEMFVKIKFLLCKIVKCLIINLKKFLKDNTGPKKALEIMLLFASEVTQEVYY